MHSLMVRWSRLYKWCGSKRGEIVFESPLKIVQRGKNKHFRHHQLKKRPPWMFLCKFIHPGTLGYFAIWSPRHIQNFLLCLLESVSTCGHQSKCVCVCLHYSRRFASPPTAWQLHGAKFQAAPHSPHMAPRGSPTPTPRYLKRKKKTFFLKLNLACAATCWVTA